MNDKLDSLKAEALSEMLSRGYRLNELLLDDMIHRFGPKESQWYVARHFESQIGGEPFLVISFGDWRSGEKLKFKSKSVNLSPEDRARLQEQLNTAEERERQARKQRQDEAALEYQGKWETLSESGSSPYLERKQIAEPFGARFQDDTLYVPCRNVDGEIRTLQKIQSNGDKFFLPSGEAKGCFHPIGDIKNADIILFAEGFATGASIHMATSKCVVVAFNADNLICVALALREKYPGKNFLICGDDDRGTKKPDGITPINPGRDKAKKAAKRVDGRTVFPAFKELSSKPTDFNDLHCLEGLEAVAEQIANAEIEMKEQKEPKEKDPTQTDLLLVLCANIELSHTPDEEGYATVPVNDHMETWALKSQGFRKWLSREYYSKYGSAPCSQAIQDALGTLGARAQFDGEERPVFLRIAQRDGRVYVDLANKDWEVVEITSDGWSVLRNSPVKFIRSKRMLALPHPIRGDEGVAQLRKFLNVETESEDFKLIVAWLVNAYNPAGPYLVLVLYGEQGSAKSTTVKAIRALVDPNEAPLRCGPRNADDLMVSAKGNWVVAIDNMSHLPDWLSDDFCRLATGGGLSKRQLYTDDEETVLNAKRPIILNGIDEFVARGDLASRTITLQLPMISEETRKREKTFWAEFEEARPKILAALFDGISTALKSQNEFELEGKLRMADAWHWVSAAESAFGWTRGASVDAFRANQIHANDIVLDSSPIYPGIRRLSEKGWSGTPTDLLSNLNSMRGGAVEFDRFWPKNAKNLTDRIRRINPALKLAGIEVIFSKTTGSNSERNVSIRKAEKSFVAIDASTQKHSKCDEGDDCDAENSVYP